MGCISRPRPLVTPYHPSFNGLAERVVQTSKQGLRKSTEGTLEDWLQLARVLFSYRITAQLDHDWKGGLQLNCFSGDNLGLA